MKVVNLDYTECLDRAARLPLNGYFKIYGIPNGGIHAAHLAKVSHPDVTLVETPSEADVFVDDVIDSGRTRKFWTENHLQQKPFFALVDKTNGDFEWKGTWVSFPWERQEVKSGPEENIV